MGIPRKNDSNENVSEHSVEGTVVWRLKEILDSLPMEEHPAVRRKVAEGELNQVTDCLRERFIPTRFCDRLTCPMRPSPAHARVLLLCAVPMWLPAMRRPASFYMMQATL